MAAANGSNGHRSGYARPTLLSPSDDPSLLPTLLQQQSSTERADDELFRSAVERFMESPAPADHSKHRRTPTSAPAKPTAPPPERRRFPINGDEAWVAFRNGLKETGMLAEVDDDLMSSALAVNGVSSSSGEAPPSATNGGGGGGSGGAETAHTATLTVAAADGQSAPPGVEAIEWEPERMTMVAQIAALRMNLAASAKTNQTLLQELQVCRRGPQTRPTGRSS